MLSPVPRLKADYHQCCSPTFLSFFLSFSSIPPPPALRLPAPGGAGDGRAVQQRACHTLAHGDHLGRGQPAEGLPAQHAGPALHAGLEVGLLHQPQRHRLPHQVGLNSPLTPSPPVVYREWVKQWWLVVLWTSLLYRQWYIVVSFFWQITHFFWQIASVFG